MAMLAGTPESSKPAEQESGMESWRRQKTAQDKLKDKPSWMQNRPPPCTNCGSGKHPQGECPEVPVACRKCGESGHQTRFHDLHVESQKKKTALVAVIYRSPTSTTPDPVHYFKVYLDTCADVHMCKHAGWLEGLARLMGVVIAGLPFSAVFLNHAKALP